MGAGRQLGAGDFRENIQATFKKTYLETSCVEIALLQKRTGHAVFDKIDLGFIGHETTGSLAALTWSAGHH